MNTLINILYVTSIMGMIFIIRNYLVFKYSKRAIIYIYNQSNWIELEQKYLNKYDKLLFSPFKWTYKQMFKGLEE